MDAKIDQIYGENKDSLKFRGGFWFYTYARFFALQELMHNQKIDALLQVEADVLLLPNFPFESIQKIKELSYPLVNIDYAAASVLWIGSKSGIDLLCNYTLTAVLKNSKLTDMDILGSIYKDFQNEVSLLPSGLRDLDTYNSFVIDSEAKLFSSRIDYFGGIFDGMTWGQYLTGEDPRNYYGRRPIYHFQDHHSVNPTCVKFTMTYPGHLMIESAHERVKLYCLHIHSKDLNMFSTANKYSQLEKRVKYSVNKIEIFEVIPQLYWRYQFRRIRKVLKSTVKKFL
jgi:hypothetical protein